MACHALEQVVHDHLAWLCSSLPRHTITDVQTSERVSLLLKDSFVESFVRARAHLHEAVLWRRRPSRSSAIPSSGDWLLFFMAHAHACAAASRQSRRCHAVDCIFWSGVFFE